MAEGGDHLQQLTVYYEHKNNKRKLSRNFSFSPKLYEDLFVNLANQTNKEVLKNLYLLNKQEVLTKKILVHEDSFIAYLQNIEGNPASLVINDFLHFGETNSYKVWCTTVANEISGKLK